MGGVIRDRGESASSGGIGTRKTSDSNASHTTGQLKDELPTIRLIPYQDPRSNRPSLAFPATARTLPHEDCIIRVGRYSERDSNPNPPPSTPSSAPVGFKSKVVSRRHCEFWCSSGQWYIKDVKSSSGTFLNHIRLSNPSVESKPFPVHDGDMVQLGIDFRGGEEMIFRCVKIKIECNRAWQRSLNSYNVTTHKRLRDLSKPKDSDTASSNASECSICLMSIAPCQSLFVAPCSHVWHYKCIRRWLNDDKSWPIFMCPNCRARHDLDADVDEVDVKDWEDVNGGDSSPEVLTMQNRQGDQAEVTSGDTQTVMDVEERNLSRSASRNLSIEEHNAGSPPTRDPTSTIVNASFLSRRGPRRISPPVLPPDQQPAGRYVQDTAQLRPVTPTQSLSENGVSSGTSLRTPNAEFLMQDGPMTPTNNAGPFVFDGSAGRIT